MRFKEHNKSFSVDKIIINNFNYNQELNCLPEYLEYLKLPYNYEIKLSKIPKNLKILYCHQKYRWKHNFKNYIKEYGRIYY